MAGRLVRTLRVRGVTVADRVSSLPLRTLPGATLPPTLSLLPPQPSRRTGLPSIAASAFASLQSRSFSTTPLRSSPTTANQRQDGGQNEDDSSSSSSSTSSASFTQRIRILFKRYGWWAFAVYNLWSLVDFSLTWAIIHWAGADYIRQLEASVRKAVGMGQRKTSDEEIAQWPLNGQTPAVLEGVTSPPSGHENNESAAKEAVERMTHGVDDDIAAQGRMTNESKPSESSGSGTLWAEIVLAYTIHKTLLLPFRVMGTGALTPSFVKYMVKLGWAKPLAPVAAGGAATAATVGKATNAVASKGVQEAGTKGAASAVREGATKSKP